METRNKLSKNANKDMPKVILGLDAGSQESAVVAYSPRAHSVIGSIYDKNAVVLDWLDEWDREGAVLAIEQIKSYGMVVGDSVLWTCVWNGRFCERWFAETIWLTRRAVVSSLCEKGKAGDKHVRRAVIDSFPATGGGKEKAVGTKNDKGPLYGITGDMWSSLAICLTARVKWHELKEFLGETHLKL